MPVIKIDGREIPFEKGDSIIRAADRQGIEIPHYCWHPGLSVAANCRMCLVEVSRPGGRQMMLDVLAWDEEKKAYVPQKKPKLEPACQAECVEGMEVKSDSSPHVALARKSVQEMLLLNHPVDCPICDQAGECKLQDYWLENQKTGKRMLDEPVHKPKAVIFGDTIVYDAERCIVCTRCVRFMEEVAGDAVLEKRERGNLSEIVLAAGRKLEGHYTMMVDHVCPVGALTTRDFRFKARVWFLRKSKTICPGCATGCNAWLDYDPRTGEVPRLRPRDNAEVNKYWMCDDGILSHRRVQQDRVLRASIGRKNSREQVTPVKALASAADLLRAAKGKIAFILSAQRASEDNFALAALAQKLGAKELYVAKLPEWDGDEILRDKDHNPNTRGATAAAGALPIKPMADLVEPVVGAQIQLLVALGGWADVDSMTIGSLGRAKGIAVASNEGPLTELADVLLPAASWAEQDGTFTNRNGLAQAFAAGPRPAGDGLPGWEVVVHLAKAAGVDLGFTTLKQLRAAMPASSLVTPQTKKAEATTDATASAGAAE
ncbi:MAG: (2Fe-2S)-binding protein [Myxococcales bacterium]|nr:(2Fe-2S)-binding protein [Myxococcales bacterium]